ncbi:MAG TPA: hypothetical protein VIF57_05045 [Polyangia bacterium]
MEEERRLTSVLGVLLAERVDFVLVGALAAVAQGAPLTTHDVDIVHARTPQNLERLMAALVKLNARYRGRPADAPLPPDRKALATTGHSLFMTDLGPLDCLGAIEGGRTYDDLAPLSVEVDMDGRLLVLQLETIVELKKQSTEAKDRQQVPVLEETLRRRGR